MNNIVFKYQSGLETPERNFAKGVAKHHKYSCRLVSQIIDEKHIKTIITQKNV